MSGEAPAPVPDTGGTTNNNHDVIDKIWFEDDDSETLNWLLSKTVHDDMPSRLEGLAQRFRHDGDPAKEEAFWQSLTSSAREFGFESINTMAALGGAAPSTNGVDGQGSTSGCPSAFNTEAGKMHIRAVASFLDVSERRAIQLTMAALRTIHRTSSHDVGRSLVPLLSSLLGTQTLLRQVVDYYYSQRLFRLSVIAECLRIEQDAIGSDSVFLPLVSNLLNSLDSSICHADGRQRGMFRRLLALACESHVPPTVAALAPALELKSETQHLQGQGTERSSSASDGRHRRWNQFISDCVESSRFQKDLERSEAMEVLLVLLYQRIQGGVQRDDYICLLLAFSKIEFFTNLRDGARLSKQAGLMCAESMGLWRIFAKPDDDEGSDWAFNHPMLNGLFDYASSASEAAASEIDLLQRLLQRLGEHSMERSNSVMGRGSLNVMKAPESLAILSFGLLLSQSFRSLLNSTEGSDAQAYWQTFRVSGFDMAKTAGNEYGALDFLQTSLETLVEASDLPEPPTARSSNATYDWLLHANSFAAIGTGATKRVSAMSIAYSSLGREVLAALVATFQDTALSLDHPGAAANIGTLCDLAAVVFRNEPILCDPFLAEWSFYMAGGKRYAEELPLCYLMDVASKLATAAVNLAMQGQMGMENDFFLPSIAPLLRLVSSLCHSSEVVESVLDTLPRGLIRKALLHARKTYVTTESFSSNRIRVLDSISTLLRIGNGHSCRKMLMSSLEVEGSIIFYAPRLILRTVDSPDDIEVLPYVLSITADLLQSSLDEPRWAVNVASLLLAREATVPLSQLLSGGDSKVLLPATKVLLALTENLSSVVLNPAVADKEKAQFMDQVLGGILASFGVLTSSMSSLGNVPVSLSVVEIILLGIASFLTQLQPILRIESSVCTVATHARDILVNSLVAKGEAIAYFAVLPISFHLSALMDDAYQRERVFGRLENGESVKPSDGTTQHNRPPSLPFNLRLAKIFSETTTIQFDVEAWKSQKWIDPSDPSSIFGAASAAVRVLVLWASHVENYVVDKSNHATDLDSDARSEMLALSPQDLLSSLMVAPPSIRRNPIFSELWSSLGFSNMELLMRYLKVSDDSTFLTLIPKVAVLDLLATTVAHLNCSVAKMEASTLFQVLRLSPYIRPILWEFVFETRDIFQKGEFVASPELHGRVICCLRTLRILDVAIDKNLVLANALLLDESKKSDIIQPLFDCVSEAVTIMERIPMGNLFEDDTAVMKMRLATGCLSIIQSLRKSTRAMNSDSRDVGPFASVTKNTAIFGSLWRVVTKFVGTSDINRWEHGAPERYRLIILTFFASVLDVFTTEMAWDFQKEHTSEMLVDLFRNKVDLVTLVHYFTKFSGFEGFLHATKQVFAEVGLRPSNIPTAALLSFQTAPSKCLEQDFFVRDNLVDVFSAARWLTSVLPMDTDQSTLTVLLANFATAKSVFSNECYFFRALIRFSGIFIASQDHDGVGLARALLKWLRVNAEAVEASLAELGDNSLRSDTADIVCALADLVMNTTSTTSGRFGNAGADALTVLLVDLSDVCAGLFSILGITSQTNLLVLRKVCVAQQCLLASAVAVGRYLEAQPLPAVHIKDMSQRDRANLELTEVACKVLSLLECLRSTRGNLINADRNVFLTCTSLMRTVLSKKISSGTAASDGFLLKFAQVLREHRVVNLFVLEAHRAAKAVMNDETATKTSANIYHGDESDLRVVATVVNFLRAMVESRHPDLLSLFSQDHAAELITRNPLIAFAAGAVWNSTDLHRRGYLPSRESRDGVARDDPVHKLWITILITVKSLLRIRVSGDPSGDCFAEIATDFISTNRFSIVSCLNAVAAESLTLNILREASCILSLLSEACASGSPNCIHPDLHRDLSSALTGVVACISNFLGASGAAHELFNVLERLDSSSGDDWDARTSNSSDQTRNPLFAAGVPNARHEGIRYAHFAFQCLAVMTGEDYKDSATLKLGDQSHELEPQSPSTIERKGRNTMNSEFHRRMEQVAAECLFHALLVVWRLHPAASSFVLLSPGAACRPDTWPLVKPGMIIAYHCHSDSGLRIHPEKMVRVARVLHVDTVHRSWHVRVMRSGSEDTSEIDENVQLHQLVGIENLDKRRCLFQNYPAPDSAAELEQQSANSVNQPVTLGHLILVLRWCYQQKPQLSSKVRVQELAEACVAILGAEVSLYREIGAGDGGVTVTSKRIEEQLLNLFGDPNLPSSAAASDGARAAGQVLPRESKLGHVLSSSVLTAARTQLGPELRQALIEVEIKRRRLSEVNVPTNDGGMGFGGARRSSFRGLRVPLD